MMTEVFGDPDFTHLAESTAVFLGPMGMAPYISG